MSIYDAVSTKVTQLPCVHMCNIRTHDLALILHLKLRLQDADMEEDELAKKPSTSASSRALGTVGRTVGHVAVCHRSGSPSCPLLSLSRATCFRGCHSTLCLSPGPQTFVQSVIQKSHRLAPCQPAYRLLGQSPRQQQALLVLLQASSHRCGHKTVSVSAMQVVRLSRLVAALCVSVRRSVCIVRSHSLSRVFADGSRHGARNAFIRCNIRSKHRKVCCHISSFHR